MNVETAFLAAAGITLGVSAAVVLAIYRPLRRVLADLCGTGDRAGFWHTYANILLILLPLLAVMLARPTDVRRDESVLLLMVDQVKWSLLGVIAALTAVALGVLAFVQPGTRAVHVSADQMDDLQRLLAKVEDIRARDILRRNDTA
jgi:hypothetical protein